MASPIYKQGPMSFASGLWHGTGSSSGKFGDRTPTRTAAELEEQKQQQQIQIAIDGTAAHEVEVLLREMREHAAAAERNLWDLREKLREKTEEAERLAEGIRQAEGRWRREHRDKAFEGRDAQVEALRWSKRTHDLELEVAASERELARDREDKTRLLRMLDQHVHGGLAPTAADGFMLGASSSRSAAAANCARRISKLPVASADVLRQARYFRFAQAFIRDAAAQHRRQGYVDVQGVCHSAVHAAGSRAVLVTIASTIEPEDIARL